MKAAGASEQEFTALVAEKACGLAANLTDGKGEGAALAIARRVSRWTWNDYRVPKSKVRSTADDAALAARRADGAKTVSAARKQRSETLIVHAAMQLQREGGPVTQVAVLARVKAVGVTSERTVRRHWPSALEALAAMRSPDIRPSSVKKDPSSFSAITERSLSSESIPVLPQAYPSKSSGFVPVHLRPRLPVPAFLLRQPASPVVVDDVLPQLAYVEEEPEPS